MPKYGIIIRVETKMMLRFDLFGVIFIYLLLAVWVYIFINNYYLIVFCDTDIKFELKVDVGARDPGELFLAGDCMDTK